MAGPVRPGYVRPVSPALRHLLGLLLVLVVPTSVFSQAWTRGEPSARATGVAGAGVAVADGADVVFFNPAGLAALPGTQVLATAVFDARDVSLRGFDRSVFDADQSPDPGGGVFVSHALAEGLTGGLGAFTPWGFEVEWDDPDDFTGRFVSTSSSFRVFQVSPALAYALDDRLAVGVAVDVVDAKLESARFEQDPGLSALGGGGPIPLAASSFELAGDAIGWSVGVRARPVDGLALGLRYREEVAIDLAGPVEFSIVAPASLREFRLPDGTRVGDVLEARFEDQAARLEIVLPRGLAFGAAWETDFRVRLVAEASWTDWDESDAFAFGFRDPALSDTIPLAYRSAWTFRGGAEYRDPTGVVLRAGYGRERSPAPVRGVNPLLPDADRDTFSIGVGVGWNRVEIDAGYRISLFEDREGIAFPSDGSPDGIYETVAHRLSVGVARRF